MKKRKIEVRGCRGAGDERDGSGECQMGTGRGGFGFVRRTENLEILERKWKTEGWLQPFWVGNGPSVHLHCQVIHLQSEMLRSRAEWTRQDLGQNSTGVPSARWLD